MHLANLVCYSDFLFFDFESTFIKIGDSETRKDLGSK